MNQRHEDARGKLTRLDSLLARGASAEELFQAASKARVALESRAADATIGLPEAEARLLEALRTATRKALAAAAERSHVDAAIGLGQWVFDERDETNAASAVKALERVAEGDRSGGAQRLLGYFAFHGLGRKKDDKASLAFHRKAAARGDADAMFELYAMLSQGLGAKPDPDEALTWCHRSAEAGNVRAMSNMGGFYATGRGVRRDERLSLQWYERAADLGHGKAAATLGVMHASGQGAPRDPDRARGWLERADDLGYDWRPLARVVGLDVDTVLSRARSKTIGATSKPARVKKPVTAKKPAPKKARAAKKTAAKKPATKKPARKKPAAKKAPKKPPPKPRRRR